MMKELEIINTINDIINILPVIFQYVVPGYFCIHFYMQKSLVKTHIYGKAVL